MNNSPSAKAVTDKAKRPSKPRKFTRAMFEPPLAKEYDTVLARIKSALEARGVDSLEAPDLAECFWESIDDSSDTGLEFESESDKMKFMTLAAETLAVAYVQGYGAGIHKACYEVFGDREGEAKGFQGPGLKQPAKVYKKLMKISENADDLWL